MVEQDCALDYIEEDRLARAIMFHMVLSLAGGMMLGALDALLAYGPEPVHSMYESYAYLLFVVLVGRTAAGLGWAVLSGALATFGPIISLLAVTLFDAGTHLPSLGVGGPALNLTVAVLTSFAVLAHLTRRDDVWADLASGALAGVAVIAGLSKTLTGGMEHLPELWPWHALIVAAAALGLLPAPRGGDRKGSPALSAFLALSVACAAFACVDGL